eukprot:GHVU01126285.1.p2 GENE.GHVU01126285.1~~GHVU01126285.1.p2  ORF type:complete len:112 (+),score=11.93 GHVU01126285.1:35-370(+)
MSDAAQTLPAADPMMDGTTAPDAATLCTVGALMSALQRNEGAHAGFDAVDGRTDADVAPAARRGVEGYPFGPSATVHGGSATTAATRAGDCRRASRYARALGRSVTVCVLP